MVGALCKETQIHYPAMAGPGSNQAPRDHRATIAQPWRNHLGETFIDPESGPHFPLLGFELREECGVLPGCIHDFLLGEQ